VAREAAYRTRISYRPEQPAAGFDAPGAVTVAAKMRQRPTHADPEGR
jgi:hypothetical protein